MIEKKNKTIHRRAVLGPCSVTNVVILFHSDLNSILARHADTASEEFRKISKKSTFEIITIKQGAVETVVNVLLVRKEHSQ